MKSLRITFTWLIYLQVLQAGAQTFSRSELPTPLTTPFEIIYGPDAYLWISEAGGVVSRIDPVSGNKTIVYTAPDYFGGSPLEQWPLCNMPNIGSGTLGMALHPDFNIPDSAFIFYVYSYNDGTPSAPATRFKIVRLKWDPVSGTISNPINLVTDLPNGYDHLGGRLMAVRRSGADYLFFTTGDNGISEDSSPTCYNPQSTNPNNFTQDPAYKNGKTHRYNLDGTIPPDNPVPGNSMYTRGHRNPQGLMFNEALDILYNIEHGDRTDDEINILLSGGNYGWKYVRGYHGDNNYTGEAAFVSSFVPDPAITGDALREPFYVWCDVPTPASGTYLDWCTVAPSDGIYYDSPGIPEWTNSLLVVTLKDGVTTDQEVYQFKLQPNGTLVPPTPQDPNPRKYFGSDQLINGRLRDIAFSPDGLKIYLINNYGSTPDKISIYTYTGPSGINETATQNLVLSPNPVQDVFKVNIPDQDVKTAFVIDATGKVVKMFDSQNTFDVSVLDAGIYLIEIRTDEQDFHFRFIKN